MSVWQRVHASDSIKNLEGIIWLFATCAELGKNGPPGPSPSPSIEMGASEGLRITYCLLHDSRAYQAATPMADVRIITEAVVSHEIRSDPRRRSNQYAISRATATA